MADETEVEVNEQVEGEARALGWVPKEEFRGNEAKWVDAQTFLDKGKSVLPILRKTNEQLEGKVSSLTAQLMALKGELETTKEGLNEQREFYEEQLVERVKQERAALKAAKKVAREENDVDRELEIDDQLNALNNAETDVKGKLNGKAVVEKKPDGQDPNAQLSPDFLAWKSNNQWFETDPDKRLDAMQTAERIMHDVARGRLAPLQGPAFFAELDKRLGMAKRPPGTSKVEGSRGGASNGSSNARTYADLPAEAKQICDRQAKQFVKPNGLWKTEADYRKHYVEVLERTGYFSN